MAHGEEHRLDFPDKLRHGRPTFPELHDADDADRAHLKAVLEQVPTGAGKSERALYAHIPFCDAVCSFCMFDRARRTDEGVRIYLAALRKELAFFATQPWTQAQSFTAVYIGGGTPTCLPLRDLVDLLEAIRCSYPLAPSAEVTVEGNVRHVTQELARAVLGAGADRISLGVQTFDPEQRELLSSNERSADARSAIDTLHASGCRNVDIDLIYGFPGESVERWLADVEAAIRAGVESVSVFDLIVHPQTKLGHEIMSGRRSVPGTTTRLEMLRAARDRLLGAGYRQQHLYHFVKPGFENRYLRARFDTVNDSLALGNTSEGRIDGFIFRNPPSLEEYLRLIECGEPPLIAKCLRMDDDLRLRHHVIKALELLELDRKRAERFFGEDPMDTLAEPLGRAADRGHLDVNGSTLRMTPRGALWGWNVIAELYPRGGTS